MLKEVRVATRDFGSLISVEIARHHYVSFLTISYLDCCIGQSHHPNLLIRQGNNKFNSTKTIPLLRTAFDTYHTQPLSPTPTDRLLLIWRRCTHYYCGLEKIAGIPALKSAMDRLMKDKSQIEETLSAEETMIEEEKRKSKLWSDQVDDLSNQVRSTEPRHPFRPI